MARTAAQRLEDERVERAVEERAGWLLRHRVLGLESLGQTLRPEA